MKSITEIVYEELILEVFIGFLNGYKISVDLVPHAEERQARDNKKFISKLNILYTIAKVGKDIRDDFDINIIKYNDRIKIIDKSRDKILNIICDINRDNKKLDWIKLSIITEMEDNMPTHDISKTYVTYSSDQKVKNDIKVLNNMI